MNSYKNIFTFNFENGSVVDKFKFNISVNEKGMCSFGIEGSYSQKGFKWRDDYKIEILGKDSQLKREMSLTKGSDVYLSVNTFISELNKVSIYVGDEIVFKSTSENNISVNGSLLEDISTSFIIGYNKLFRYRYKSVFSFKAISINDGSFIKYFSIPIIAKYDDKSVEYYADFQFSDNYKFADEYFITKINPDGAGVIVITIGKDSLVSKGLKEILDNLKVGYNGTYIEIMVQSLFEDDSIKVNGESIDSKVKYYTIARNKLLSEKFINIFEFKLKSKKEIGYFKYFITLGANNYARFGVHGKYRNLGFWWDDTYNVKAKSSEGSTITNVILNEKDILLNDIYKFTNNFNNRYISLGDNIQFEKNEFDSLKVNGEVISEKSSIFKITEKGLIKE